jgi:hypothetical protein
MNNPQEVIVYRSPAEYALWNSGAAFPIIAGAVAAIVVALIMASIIGKAPWGGWVNRNSGWLVILPTAIAGIGVAWWLL